jgi:beta-lactamase superfamily II metal-dependent hydrolase
MATKFLNKKTHWFYFDNELNERKGYKLIFGDEVNKLAGQGPSGADWQRIMYRNRIGEMKKPKWTSKRSLEMYFLDVGQGDAAFVVTPNNTKILFDGGLRDRALGFLIWKYRLDDQNNDVTIDYLVLSHADKDHVEGLVPVLNHPRIHVSNVLHNGIGVFGDDHYDTDLGDLNQNGELATLHDSTDDLNGYYLDGDFYDWIEAVESSGANYRAVNSNMGAINIGDPKVTLDILGPVLQPGGNSLKWFSDKSHTINGHSVVVRLTYDQVRVLFSGDLNVKGSKHLLANPTVAAKLNSHVLKAPHHGSADFHKTFFREIEPMITVVSSGDSPDHGHPRALFLGYVGQISRSTSPLIFSTEIAGTFIDDGDPEAVASGGIVEDTTLSDLDFGEHNANKIARRRFKKILPGIINVRTDGDDIYCARRVAAGYQWESYERRELYD